MTIEERDNIVLHPAVKARIEKVIKVADFEDNVIDMIRRDLNSRKWSRYHGEESARAEFGPSCEERPVLAPSPCCICRRIIGNEEIETGRVFWPALPKGALARYLCEDCHDRWHNEDQSDGLA